MQENVWECVLNDYKNDKTIIKKDFFDRFHLYYIHSNNPSCEAKDKIKIYKLLLRKIKEFNEEGYDKTHKGVPYYFIGWFSLNIKNYEQAIFYFDAALAEDKINHSFDTWNNSGAALFFKLKHEFPYPYNEFSTRKLREYLSKELNSYNPVESDKMRLDEDFVKKFVENILLENNTAIITTFYTFILEKHDILDLIELRSVHGGTIEPIVMHLFKGALIFESLLKKQYPQHGSNMGKILKAIQKEFKFKFDNSFTSCFEQIIDYVNLNNDNTIEKSFNTVYKIRNTTAHNLIWNDCFNEKNYKEMFKQVMNAILNFIYKKYVLDSR